MDAIPEQVFELLLKRFDTIEAQNNRQLELIEKHVNDDVKTREIVDRHTTYFGLMSVGIAPLAAYIATKMGWKA
jgi:tetrahydromethanopterin S-methyltransferase subunit F